MKKAISWISNKCKCRNGRFGPEVAVRLNGRTINVLVLGAQGVGKTSLIKYLLGQDTQGGLQPTVYDVYQKEFKEEFGTVVVEFTDMTGKFSFPAMEKIAIARSHVFVLVYSLERKETLNELERLRKVITETQSKHSSEIPIILVGNKMDLLDSQTELKNIVDNTVEDWCFSHIKTSVKNEINLCDLEMTLIQACAFYAVTGGTKNALRRTNSGSLVYQKSNDRKRSQYILINGEH